MGKLIKIDKAVDRFGYWIGAISIMTGGFAWMARQLDAYHIGWPEAFFIGLFSACLLIFVVSLGLIGWRLFNPIEKLLSPELKYQPDERTSLSQNEVNTLINAHMIALRRDMDGALENNQTAYLRLAEEVSGLGDNLGAATSQANNAHQRIDEIIESIAAMRRDWETWTRQQTDRQEKRFEWVDGGFRAILDRERILFYARRLAEHTDFLLRPRHGERIDDWRAWVDRRGLWQADLDAWLELADVYRVKASERVRQVRNDVLEGKWDEDELLPSARDTVVAYRWVAATHDNYCSEKGHVERAVMSAAVSVILCARSYRWSRKDHRYGNRQGITGSVAGRT